jgi:hypothetical protein
MPMPLNGEVKGDLVLKSSGPLAPEDFLKFHPETKAHLDDIVKQGWKYQCNEARGTAISRVTADKAYWLGAAPAFMRSAKGAKAGTIAQTEYGLVVYIGTVPPEVEGVPEVEGFRISISSKSFPSAAAVDLVKGVVTYLHDSFWKWEKGWETDKKKVADAVEVYDVARWLFEVKKFKLVEGLKPERYDELAAIFKALPK